MVVELISVGTEILMGNILNSNTQYLAEKCALGLHHQYTDLCSLRAAVGLQFVDRV